jgi:hypothetical protein
LYGYGIGSNGCNNLVIDENEIHIRGKHPTYKAGAGIVCGGSDSAFVTQNEVRGYGPLTDELDGIRVDLSPEVHVKCNEIFNFRNDLRFWGSSLGATFRDNDFTGGLRGVVYENNGYMGPQGRPYNPPGNHWLSGIPGQGLQCGGGVFMVLPINTTIPISDEDSVVNSQWQNPGNQSNLFCSGMPPNHYVATTDTSASTCASSGIGNPGSNRLAVLKKIANHEYEYGFDSAMTRYLEEQLALAYFQGDTTIPNGNSLLLSLYDDLKQGNRFDIQRAQEKISEFKFSEASTFNKFSPKNWIESNHKEVTTLLAKWESKGSFESSDSTTLVQIAKNCAINGGESVYQARMLLALLDPSKLYFDENCTALSSKLQQGESSSFHLSDVEFYPNPTTSEVRALVQVEGRITMYNLNGQELGAWDVLPGENTLKPEKMPKGVYLFRYVLANGVSGTKRIVFQ